MATLEVRATFEIDIPTVFTAPWLHTYCPKRGHAEKLQSMLPITSPIIQQCFGSRHNLTEKETAKNAY